MTTHPDIVAAGIPADLDTLLQKWADARESAFWADEADEERAYEALSEAWNAMLRGLLAWRPAPATDALERALSEAYAQGVIDGQAAIAAGKGVL